MTMKRIPAIILAIAALFCALTVAAEEPQSEQKAAAAPPPVSAETPTGRQGGTIMYPSAAALTTSGTETAVATAPSVSPGPPSAPEGNIATVNRAFGPGERLEYSVSWSNIIEAGIAVMEVVKGKPVDGRPTYDLISTTRSVGLLDLVYSVRDRVESVIDARDLYSISFNLKERHGGKKRQRQMDFDQVTGTVRDELNNDPPQTFKVPDRVQDALSSLFYVRTRSDLKVGKTMTVYVHDDGKNWAVEVHVLRRNRVKTPAGEFDTILVKTYPKYEGVFMHKGEIYIWLTDDARRIPVLMKSKISIGSIMATLVKYREGVVNGDGNGAP